MECGLDLHAKLVNETEQVGFGNLAEENWLNNTTNDQDGDLLGMNMNDDASVFYADFPPLPDFPCMSSSSSSSSSSTPLKTIACTSTTTTTTSSSSSASSSSAASWAVLKSDVEVDHQGYSNMHQKHGHPLDYHHGHPPTTLSSTASMEISQQQQQDLGVSNNDVVGGGDCMDDVNIMDTFGYMELLEANEFFDPASIFQNEDENPLVDFTQEQQVHVQDGYQQQQQHQQVPMIVHDDRENKPQQVNIEENNDDVFVCDGVNGEESIQGDELGACDGVSDEMSMVFLEWLKSNKDSVSANDLRNVKLKKSTIESAARRLGGGKEGMKQLLKLILEWVQTSHLQNKRLKENTNNNTIIPSNFVPQQQQFQDPCQNQNTANTFAPESNACFNQTSWLDQTPLIVPPQQFSQPMVGVGVGFVADPYTNGSVSNNINPYQPAATNEYHMLESNHSWGASQFNVAPNYNQSFVENNNNVLQPHGMNFGGYGNQYNSYQLFPGPGDRLMRLGPSATKEARKKRMARQRRFMSHHRHHNNNHHQNIQGSDPLARLGSGDNCTNAAGGGSHANPANWMYWQTMTGGTAASLAPVVPAEPTQPPVDRDRPTMQTQSSHQGRNASDRRQVCGLQLYQIIVRLYDLVICMIYDVSLLEMHVYVKTFVIELDFCISFKLCSTTAIVAAI